MPKKIIKNVNKKVAKSSKIKPPSLPAKSKILLGFAIVATLFILGALEFGTSILPIKKTGLLPIISITPSALVTGVPTTFTPAITAKAGKLAYLVPGKSTSEATETYYDIWTSDAEGNNRTQLTDAGDVVTLMSWSPDNKYLLIDRNLERVPAVLEVATKKVTNLKAYRGGFDYYFWGTDSNLYHFDEDVTISKVEFSGKMKVVYKGSDEMKGLAGYFAGDQSALNSKTLQVLFNTADQEAGKAALDTYIYDIKTQKLTLISKGGTMAEGWIGDRAWVSKFDKDSQGKFLDTIRYWSFDNTGKGERLENMPPEVFAPGYVQFEPRGKIVAYSNYVDENDSVAMAKRGFYLYNRSTRKTTKVSEYNDSQIEGAIFSRDSRLLLYELRTEKIDADIVFDTETGKSAHVCDSGCSNFLWQR